MLTIGPARRFMPVMAAAILYLTALAAHWCAASGSPADTAAAPRAAVPAATVVPDRSASFDTTRDRAADRHKVRVTKSYYVSLCSYGLGQLGFGGKKFNPDYADFARRLDATVGTLGFRPPVAEGPFLQLVYQIPGYLDPESPKELDDVFAAVRRFIESGSLDEFRQKWPAEARGLEGWFPGSAKSYFERTLGGREYLVRQALDTWAQYMRLLWPKYRPEYETALKDYPFEAYESACNRLDVFEAWQREFGVEYPYTDFVLVVCPENPTMAAGIGPDKVVFGAIHSWERMKNSVVHEVGTRLPSLRLLFEHPATSAAMSADYEDMLRLVQMEVCYRTPRIVPDLAEDSFVKGMRLERLMAWRKRQELTGSLKDAASTGPAELLSQLYARAKRDGVL